MARELVVPWSSARTYWGIREPLFRSLLLTPMPRRTPKPIPARTKTNYIPAGLTKSQGHLEECAKRFGVRSRSCRFAPCPRTARTKGGKRQLRGRTPKCLRHSHFHTDGRATPCVMADLPGPSGSWPWPITVCSWVRVGYYGYMPHFADLASNAFLLYFHQYNGKNGLTYLFSST